MSQGWKIKKKQKKNTKIWKLKNRSELDERIDTPEKKIWGKMVTD